MELFHFVCDLIRRSSNILSSILCGEHTREYENSEEHSGWKKSRHDDVESEEIPSKVSAYSSFLLL